MDTTKHSKNYLSLQTMKPNYLYLLKARNFEFGIWKENEQGFLGKRHKFGEVFTFTEVHWDASEDFGTAKPLTELEKTPFTQEDLEYDWDNPKVAAKGERALLDYLEEVELRYATLQNKD